MISPNLIINFWKPQPSLFLTRAQSKQPTKIAPELFEPAKNWGINKFYVVMGYGGIPKICKYFYSVCRMVEG